MPAERCPLPERRSRATTLKFFRAVVSARRRDPTHGVTPAEWWPREQPPSVKSPTPSRRESAAL
eukprot:1360259-Pyramimonas_sp.AAC.1